MGSVSSAWGCVSIACLWGVSCSHTAVCGFWFSFAVASKWKWCFLTWHSLAVLQVLECCPSLRRNVRLPNRQTTYIFKHSVYRNNTFTFLKTDWNKVIVLFVSENDVICTTENIWQECRLHTNIIYMGAKKCTCSLCQVNGKHTSRRHVARTMHLLWGCSWDCSTGHLDWVDAFDSNKFFVV